MEKATVNLSTEDLIKYCSNNKLPKEDLLIKLQILNREEESSVHKIFGYRKFNYDFTDRVTIYNENDSLGNIRLSYTDFLLKLRRYLNVKENISKLTSTERDKVYRNRLEVLDSINDLTTLQKEFPIIYNDYIKGLSYLSEVKKMPSRTEEEKRRKRKEESYYYRCAGHPNKLKFLERQKELYKRFVDRKEEYKKVIEENDLNDFFNEYFDMNKVALYTVHSYLRICEKITDKNKIKYYLDLISKYIDSDYDKSVELLINGNKVNINTIKDRISAIKETLNNKDLTTTWELIPDGRGYDRVEKDSKHESKRLSLSPDEIMRLREKGFDKEEFYKENEPLRKAIGLARYAGYIAYIYPNGEVLVDTEFDYDRPQTALGNALYNIKARDFEVLSRLDKQQLRGREEVEKIVHSKYWKERAKRIIDKEPTEQEKEESLQLIKRLEKK